MEQLKEEHERKFFINFFRSTGLDVPQKADYDLHYKRFAVMKQLYRKPFPVQEICDLLKEITRKIKRMPLKALYRSRRIQVGIPSSSLRELCELLDEYCFLSRSSRPDGNAWMEMSNLLKRMIIFTKIETIIYKFIPFGISPKSWFLSLLSNKPSFSSSYHLELDQNGGWE